ncbi:MAG: hypothetical protein WCR77_05135 [Bacilli bacterium]|nr:hypothetical protein [Bacilli bacterium]
MKLTQNLKKKFMRNALKSSSQKHPFEIEKADHFLLSNLTGDNMTNSHYFSGHDMEGTSFFFRYAIRSNQTTEVWFCLKTNDGKIYVNTQELYSSSSCPAHVRCDKTGEEMTFIFHGDVSLAKKGDSDVLSLDKEIVKIDAKAHFIASMPPFDFSTMLDPNFVAEALAKQKWNKFFWRNLKLNRQVHYEQAGVIKLELTIKDQTFTYVLPAMRDHSFGYRDWDYMNRHIWLMVLFEDGEVLNLNMVNYPHMQDLMTGYRSIEGKHRSVRAITNLKELGTEGHVPQDIEVELPSLEGKTVTLNGKRDFVAKFTFNNDKYCIYEGVGEYTYGQKRGRGILEFGYNHDHARWK